MFIKRVHRVGKIIKEFFRYVQEVAFVLGVVFVLGMAWQKVVAMKEIKEVLLSLLSVVASFTFVVLFIVAGESYCLSKDLSNCLLMYSFLRVWKLWKPLPLFQYCCLFDLCNVNMPYCYTNIMLMDSLFCKCARLC